MRTHVSSLFALLAIALFTTSAFAEDRPATIAPAELAAEDVEEGSGGEEVEEMAGPAPRIATTANEERQVEEVNEGEQQDDPRYGSGGN